MNDLIDSVIGQVTEQLESELGNSGLLTALKANLEQRQDVLNELVQAKQNGDLTEQEFDVELEREKRIQEAELLTQEIAVKAEVQKLVNKAFEALSKAVNT